MINPSVSRNGSTRRWIAIAGGLGLLVVVVLQWRLIAHLRQEINSLRAQPQAAPPEVASPPVMPAAAKAIDLEQLQSDRLELLRLRNEVRQLREQVSPPIADARPVASQLATSRPPATPPAGDGARQLVVAAVGGETSALDQLANLVAGIHTMKPEEQREALSGIKTAFEWLGTEAGNGNASALQVLWQASRIRRLQGFAAQGLGQAAALGNEEALKPLLDPEAYLLLRSSAVSALKPVADVGNERAIQALADTAADPKQQALWLLAAQGLETAAAAGNVTAINGLTVIATATNQMISKEAVLALEAAARNSQPQAEEALRKLGWR